MIQGNEANEIPLATIQNKLALRYRRLGFQAAHDIQSWSPLNDAELPECVHLKSKKKTKNEVK